MSRAVALLQKEESESPLIEAVISGNKEGSSLMQPNRASQEGFSKKEAHIKVEGHRGVREGEGNHQTSTGKNGEQ